MTIDDQINRLMANRSLSTPEQILAFDDALAMDVEDPKQSDIVRLFLVFDDDTADEEVMFGLLHYIWHLCLRYSIEFYVETFLQSLPGMCTQAMDWALTALCRMLNNESSRKALEKKIDRKQELEIRDALVKILAMVPDRPAPRKRLALDLTTRIQEAESNTIDMA